MLTAEQAYKAGIEDLRRGMVIVAKLIRAGTITEAERLPCLKEVMGQLLIERMAKGELPHEIKGGVH